jgi:hypothetical protein
LAPRRFETEYVNRLSRHQYDYPLDMARGSESKRRAARARVRSKRERAQGLLKTPATTQLTGSHSAMRAAAFASAKASAKAALIASAATDAPKVAAARARTEISWFSYFNFVLSTLAVVFAGYAGFAALDQADTVRAQYAAEVQAATTKLLVEGDGVRVWDSTKWSGNFENGTLAGFADPNSRVYAVVRVTNIGQSIGIIDEVGVGSVIAVKSSAVLCSDPAAPKGPGVPMETCSFPRSLDAGATRLLYVQLTPSVIDALGCDEGDTPLSVWVTTVDGSVTLRETDFWPGPSGAVCATPSPQEPDTP